MPDLPDAFGPRSSLIEVVAISNDRQLLAAGGDFHVSYATLESALAAPERLACDVAVVDVRDRHRHLEVARLVAASRMAVVVFGPPDDPEQSMRYLDLGADDYISVRTRATEMEARIRATARRSGAEDDDWMLGGPMSISLSRQEVRLQGVRIHLTPNEYRVLETLALHPGQIVSHREVLARVWGAEHVTARHYLRVYVRQVREKLRDAGSGQLVETVPGVGYRLNVAASRASRAGRSAS